MAPPTLPPLPPRSVPPQHVRPPVAPPRVVHPFVRRTLDDLTIEDERSFRHVGIYAELKEVLLKSGYAFRVLPDAGLVSWDRAAFLNLTFWGASEGGDVLVEPSVPADVVAHVAWHHLAAKALAGVAGKRPSVQGLFLGEAIASAFDLYLVGRLLGHAPKSTFLATQVPAMAEAAEGAGVEENAFDQLLSGVAADPEAAFGSLRELLSDCAMALFESANADAALGVLARFDAHRFGGLLHHYELSNWVLYARAYGDPAPDPKAEAIDAGLRAANDPVAWLAAAWL